MKKLVLILLAAAGFLTANAIEANRTMYVMKDNTIVFQSAVSEIDSIIFYNPSCPCGCPDENNRKNIITYTVNDVCFNMVNVQGGTFTMGAQSSNPAAANYDAEALNDRERPTHSVTLSNYAIGETEVTQGLWYAVMGFQPTETGTQWNSTVGLANDKPAYYVSWNDAQTFISKLNNLTGKTFRLPTEAEWEYAARGGNKSEGYKYAGSNIIDNVAWYYDNSRALGEGNPNFGVQAVKSKQANELGIYDMSGNVVELCNDWYGTYSSNAQTNPIGATPSSIRVNRGGCWNNYASDHRISSRSRNPPDYRDYGLGLRLALSEE